MADTTNARARFVKIAKSQIGYGTGKKSNKYTLWYYGKPTYAEWCNIFVSWVSYKAGTLKAVPKFAFVPYTLNWYKKRSLFLSRYNSKVAPGDLVFYDWNNDNSPDHMGIVKLVSNGYIVSVEGNVSSTQYVTTRKIRRSSKYIMGFAHPNFADSSSGDGGSDSTDDSASAGAYKPASVKSLQQALNSSYGVNLTPNGIWNAPTRNTVIKRLLRYGSINDHVKWMQVMLNDKGATLKTDRIFGPKTLAALKKFQRANGLDVDGICGINTTKQLVK